MISQDHRSALCHSREHIVMPHLTGQEEISAAYPLKEPTTGPWAQGDRANRRRITLMPRMAGHTEVRDPQVRLEISTDRGERPRGG